MADSKLTALTEVSVPDLDDLSYLVDVSDTTDDAAGSSRKATLRRMLAMSGITPGGRITLESGVPVSTSNQTSKSTIYYTPYAHDWVRLYDGTRPKLYQFTECSLALSGLTSGKNYDVFLYDNSGTLTLELSAAWTNDTTRADALAWQAGVGYVKSGTATRLWLGTIRTTGTTTTEQSFATTDAPVKQFVWNAYNRVTASVLCLDSTDSWTYTTATWRQKRGSANNQIEVVSGLAGASAASLRNTTFSTNSAGNTRRISIGMNSTSAIDSYATSAGTQVSSGTVAFLSRSAGLGYSYFSALEWSVAIGTSTFFGDAGDPTITLEGFCGTWEC